MQYIELYSERLLFRKFRQSDFPIVYDWLSSLENMKDTSELIGSCELYFTDKDPAGLAWELHRNYWKQGYGTEIGNSLLRLAFDVLKLRRVIADCNTLNIGSYRIMEKIGMRREAHFVKMYQGNSALDHRWCDKYQYAILREEWLNRDI